MPFELPVPGIARRRIPGDLLRLQSTKVGHFRRWRSISQRRNYVAPSHLGEPVPQGTAKATLYLQVTTAGREKYKEISMP